MGMKRVVYYERAFTLVELAIVIAVIAVLAAIGLAMYDSAQDRARATQIVAMYTDVEEGMQLAMIKQGWSTWPRDNVIEGFISSSDNVLLSSLIGSSTFSAYMSAVVLPDGTEFRYDNDDDTYTSCGAGTEGVSIYSRSDAPKPVPRAVAQRVDDILDDGNLSCGRVIYDTARSEFKIFLSFDKNIK
jgi:prepilin-type N-terminal cleavage/methylation domain-containing protein